MRYIKIDPVAQTVTEGDHPGQIDWRVLRELIGGWICTGGLLSNGDILWVDDEGLLKGPQHFFHMAAVNQQPLAGIGIVTGPEDFLPEGREPGEEEISDARSSVAEIAAGIVWLDRMKVTAMTQTTVEEPGFTHIFITPTIEPA